IVAESQQLGRPVSTPYLIQETAQRTRQQLKDWGVPVKARKRESLAPRGEMSSRRTGGRAVTRKQQDLDAFMASQRLGGASRWRLRLSGCGAPAPPRARSVRTTGAR